jgi:hypothetical protein
MARKGAMVLRIPSASILRTTVTLTVKFLSRQYSYSSGLRINVPTALPELHAPPHSVHAPQESDIASHVHGYLRSAHNMHQDRLARKEHRQRPALRAGRLALPARPHGRTHAPQHPLAELLHEREHIRVPKLARATEEAREVSWSQENKVHVRHRQDGVQVRRTLRGLDLDAHLSPQQGAAASRGDRYLSLGTVCD